MKRKKDKKKWAKMLTTIGSYVITIMVQGAYASATSTTNPTGTPPGASLATSELVTGTQALIADATKVLLLLSGGLTAALVIFNLVKLQAAEEQDVIQIKKRIKTILIVGILVFLVSGLLSIIMSYYGSSVTI